MNNRANHILKAWKKEFVKSFSLRQQLSVNLPFGCLGFQTETSNWDARMSGNPFKDYTLIFYRNECFGIAEWTAVGEDIDKVLSCKVIPYSYSEQASPECRSCLNLKWWEWRDEQKYKEDDEDDYGYEN